MFGELWGLRRDACISNTLQKPFESLETRCGRSGHRHVVEAGKKAFEATRVVGTVASSTSLRPCHRLGECRSLEHGQ